MHNEKEDDWSKAKPAILSRSHAVWKSKMPCRRLSACKIRKFPAPIATKESG